MNVLETEKIIQYKFKNPDLLKQALVHSSYANEQWENSLLSNERLEYLGDSVLDLIIGEWLFKCFPDKPEGDLTKMRAALVCEASLGKIGLDTGLNSELILGKGEEASGGRNRISIIADMIESIIAAVYLDGGFDAAKSVILHLLEVPLKTADHGYLQKDSKTELQEFLQRDGEVKLEYEIVAESGPDHAKEFTAVVRLNNEELGRGSGSSKKRAETEAAAAALSKLK